MAEYIRIGAELRIEVFCDECGNELDINVNQSDFCITINAYSCSACLANAQEANEEAYDAGFADGYTEGEDRILQQYNNEE